SRRRHTRFSRDWSSDVCSSDLVTGGKSLATLAAGAIGALAYAFSDTFWFSAVEGEVYGTSSLFTAAVVWAMLRWYDEADDPRSRSEERRVGKECRDLESQLRYQ